MTLRLHGIDDIRASVGAELGPTGWLIIEPSRSVLFDKVIGLAPSETVSPWMLLSITNLLMPQLIDVTGISAGLNIGTGRIEFGAPVELGARVRGVGRVTNATEVTGGVQTTIELKVEADGLSRPALTVQSLSRWLS